MPTVTVTFVKGTFVLATFVHIRMISAVTDPILTKCLEPNILQALFLFYRNPFAKILFGQHFMGPWKFFGPKIL